MALGLLLFSALQWCFSLWCTDHLYCVWITCVHRPFVTDSPLPTCARAIYHEESHEEPPADLPSKEDICFWTYGDKKDEETVSRMLDLLEDAEDAKKPYSICGCIIELGEDEEIGD